jgi:hypothetical protein
MAQARTPSPLLPTSTEQRNTQIFLPHPQGKKPTDSRKITIKAGTTIIEPIGHRSPDVQFNSIRNSVPLEEEARRAAKWGEAPRSGRDQNSRNPVRDPVSKKNPRARSDRSPGSNQGGVSAEEMSCCCWASASPRGFGVVVVVEVF